MSIALIGLGANLVDRAAVLREATRRVCADSAVRQIAASSLVETAAVGGPAAQPPFLNGALLVETELSPRALLDELLAWETALGRQTGERWGPRTVDLDLLLYDDCVVDSPDLTVPHPRMAFRRFVLVPASEIAGNVIHPTSGWPLSRLLSHLDSRPEYVAVAGGAPAERALIVQQAARRTIARTVMLSPFESDGTEHGSVEWLAEAARRLARDHWPDDRPSIGDFWFDEPVCVACAADPALAAAVQRQWQAQRSQIMPPKLVVWLDQEAALTTEGENVAAWLAQQPVARRAFYGHVLAHDVGPTLRIDASDPNRCVDEIAAAVMAMRLVV